MTCSERQIRCTATAFVGLQTQPCRPRGGNRKVEGMAFLGVGSIRGSGHNHACHARRDGVSAFRCP